MHVGKVACHAYARRRSVRVERAAKCPAQNCVSQKHTCFRRVYHLKYTSLHLNLNCFQNFRCKNPHLARKNSSFTVSRKKQNYACQLRWRLGNWVCQLTKFLRAMCLGAFFPAPKLLQVAKERLRWFGAFSAQLNTFSDYFQWRFHCLKSMRLCLVSGDSFRGTFGRTGQSLLTGVVCAAVLGPNLQCI